MSNRARAFPPMSIAEFFAYRGEEGVRYELVDGILVRAMTGASQRHDLVLVNILATLHAKLRGSPCRASTDDLAVVVPNGNVRRPDVSVSCGKLDDRSQQLADPRLVVEVLSPSTRGIDLVRKLEEYKSVPGLSYILLVEPDVPHALLWRRGAAGWELEEVQGLDGGFDLPDIEAGLSMAELYDRLTFPAGGEAKADG
ncbi:Uma2 family endonuclease [Xanthobacter aminoxidans]|uniref:Uma2 family endonuclease n=1 Tax=Xanthobacter aminoxidans TaxID=186280 RepID=UPI002022E86B|nr:Uma2 family endonuclease [Xanthobacter aminoxidans]MCL8380965.1 Uma2 family endonuclease [Xanthobacter aminoxidans]